MITPKVAMIDKHRAVSAMWFVWGVLTCTSIGTCLAIIIFIKTCLANLLTTLSACKLAQSCCCLEKDLAELPRSDRCLKSACAAALQIL